MKEITISLAPEMRDKLMTSELNDLAFSIEQDIKNTAHALDVKELKKDLKAVYRILNWYIDSY
jgi:hypothetical protein